MAQIPTTPGRSKLPTAGGGARIGGFVDASDMGASNAQQWGQLGQAVQGAGVATMRHGIQEYETAAQTASNNGYVDYMKRVGEEENRLYTLKGADAKILPHEIKEAQRVAGEMVMKGLDTPRARELFEQQRQHYDMRGQLKADEYAIVQEKAANDTSKENLRKTHLDQIAGNPDDGELFSGNVQYGMDSIEEQYRGSPPAEINRKKQEYAVLAIKARVNGIAEKHGPQAALDWLNSGVADDIMKPRPGRTSPLGPPGSMMHDLVDRRGPNAAPIDPQTLPYRVSPDGLSAEDAMQTLPNRISEEEAAQLLGRDFFGREQGGTEAGGEEGGQARSVSQDNSLIKVEMSELRKTFAGQAKEAAKKDSANHARDLGIRLGETFNSEIEIERALYGVEKEIADIARVEGIRIMKARLSAGEMTVDDNRMAIVRDIVATAKDDAGMYEMVDAIPGLTAKERKELIAEISPRLKANQARQTTAEKDAEAAAKEAKTEADAEAKEREAEFVRTEATLIAKGARDEADVQTMTDYMENVTEAQRKSIRDTAIARLKVKNTAIARDKANAESEAMKEMQKAGWDPSAISSEWSGELQDKMRELAGKNRKPDPLKAMEYTDMSREQLQQAVRDGQWPEIELHVKGISTEMYNQVARLAFGDEASLKGARNVMQVGRDEFIFRTQASPSTREGQLSYSNFVRQFEPALVQKARSLGLDDLNKIPSEEVNEVLDTLLKKGKYVDGVWTWAVTGVRDIAGAAVSYVVPFVGDNLGRSISSPDTFAFQVNSDPRRDMQYFVPNQTPGQSPTPSASTSNVGGTVSSTTAMPSISPDLGGTLITREQVPDYARDFVGEGAKDIRLLDNGTVTHLNRNGDKIEIMPDGRKFKRPALNPRPVQDIAAEIKHEAAGAFYDIAEYGGIR